MNKKEKLFDEKNNPKHVSFIMDGNGRWANERGLKRTDGHQEGAKRVLEIVEYAHEIGLEAVTFYAFSTENWKRNIKEVKFLMELPKKIFGPVVEEYKESNIKINILGTRDKIPEKYLEELDKLIDFTKDNTGLQVNVALNYGGRQEITEAVKKIVENNYELSEIDEKLISDNLYTGNLPDIDLMIRTSGEMRLSNFMLWQHAYSEFIFTETKWPDFTSIEFDKCLSAYTNRDRRFGGAKENVRHK